MPSFIDRPVQTYEARPGNPYSVVQVIPASWDPIDALRISMTDDLAGGWPVNEPHVVTVTLITPSGELMAFTEGGPPHRNRQGQPLPVRVSEFRRYDRAFEKGPYRLQFDVAKTFASAIKVESLQGQETSVNLKR